VGRIGGLAVALRISVAVVKTVDTVRTASNNVVTQAFSTMQVTTRATLTPSTPSSADYDRAQQISDRQAGYDRRYAPYQQV
jgi:hypothetical protein